MLPICSSLKGDLLSHSSSEIICFALVFEDGGVPARDAVDEAEAEGMLRAGRRN